MIKPETLWNFLKTCTDTGTVGRVCRALGRQQVELNPGEQLVVEMIQNDSKWMDERISAVKERDRERKRIKRMKAIAESCPPESAESPDSRTSVHPSVHPSVKINNNRSVNVPLPPAPENGTERNVNGTGNLIMLIPGGRAKAITEARKFAKAIEADNGAIFDPDYDPVTICAAITGDFKSLKRWRQLATAKGEAAVRDVAFAFFREITSGEDVDNRGAALNSRLTALPDAQERPADASDATDGKPSVRDSQTRHRPS